MSFVRMLARVVRAEDPWRFRAGSDEEKELELVAYMQLCMHAVRYDESLHTHGTREQHFRGWMKRPVMTELRRAAEKLYYRGLCQIPEDRPSAPRCETCTEFVERAAADLRRARGEEEDAPAALVVPASFAASALPPVTYPTGYAYALPSLSEQLAKARALRKKG